jgi:hypothetical protein
MKSLISLIIVATLFYSLVTLAAEVRKPGQAMSLCKAEAMASHENYLSSKSKRIRQTRNGFELKLRVRLDDKTINANCDVSRDGNVLYAAS